MLEVIVLSIYTGGMILLGLFAVMQLQLALLRRRARRTLPSPPPSVTVWPFVTVQIPIYNEQYVAARILEHVAALDYPRDRLEIQVLDDSTDETRAIIDARVDALRRDGLPIAVLRRPARTGFKAGALRDGLQHATGALVAIFDADFLPRPDFLTTTVPYFVDERLAVAQARWGYINERQTLFTRIQAFFLDVHFTVEQTGRSSAGMFANFNGTAGVWRRAAIDDAGGWRADTLTEDVDLSFRAQLRGWRIQYLEGYDAPSELPVDMRGFRSQQFRWMKGGAENARIHLRTVLASSLPWRTKLHACAHLLGSSVYLLLLGAILLSVPLALLKNSYIATDYVHYGMLFFASTAALSCVYYASRGDAVATLAGKAKFLPMMAAFLVFTMGLALHNGVAALRGWTGEWTEFTRTPKYGDLTGRLAWTRSRYAGQALDRSVLGEVGMIFYLAIGLVHGLRAEDYGLVPIQAMATLGLAWVVSLTLVDHFRVHRASSAAPREAATLEPADSSVGP